MLALFLGIIPTAVAYLLFASGLKRLTAGVLGAVVLAEPLSGPAVAGAGLVLAGLAALAVKPPAAIGVARAGPGMMG